MAHPRNTTSQEGIKFLRSRPLLHDYWQQHVEAYSQMKVGARLPTVEHLISAYLDLYAADIGLIEGKAPTLDQLVRLYMLDESFFFVQLLRIVPWVNLKAPGSDQLGMLEAHHFYPRIAVRSGHKVSKSNSIVGLALYWFVTRDMARVVVTSSSFAQVKQIIWYELKNVYRGCMQRGTPIGGKLAEDPASGLDAGDGRQVFGFSTKEPERAAGISGKNIRYKIDEASGVYEPVFEAIEGNRAGGAGVELYSNPTRTSGTFYRAFHDDREYYKLLHISSETTPNLQAGHIIVPGLASPEWVEEKKKEWGKSNPLYRVRVSGDFPSQGANSVIPIELIDDAKERYADLYYRDVVLQMPGSLTLGVDVARFGDDETVIQPVRGRVAYEAETGYNMDGNEVAARIIKCVERYRRQDDAAILVMIDEINPGCSVIDSLGGLYSMKCRELRILPVPVNAAEKALDETKYTNRRAEMAFMLRLWLEDGAAIPPNSRLEGEMASLIYKFDNKLRYQLPDKAKHERVELGRSPDRRDALALAVYRSVARLVEFASSGHRETHGGRLSRFTHSY